MKYLLFLTICCSLSVSCFAGKYQWMDEQIREDLSYLSQNSIYSSQLESWFQEISQRGLQALYFKIRQRNLEWQESLASDQNRNNWIFQFFSALNQRFKLPDTDFILFTGDGLGSGYPLPIFTFAKNKNATNVCLVPDFEMFMEILEPSKNWISLTKKYTKNYPWDKKMPLAFFRGCSTGQFNPDYPDFRNDRVRAVLFSSEYPELLDATFNRIFQEPIKNLLTELKKDEHGTSIKNHFLYKYLLDIDGNSCTYSRCRWILLSNSVLLKVMSPNIQWYYKTLDPWVNFIPIQQDLSNLTETLLHLQHHDELAKEIAQKGRQVGKKIFCEKSIYQYVYRLIRSYAQFVKVDN